MLPFLWAFSSELEQIHKIKLLLSLCKIVYISISNESLIMFPMEPVKMANTLFYDFSCSFSFHVSIMFLFFLSNSDENEEYENIACSICISLCMLRLSWIHKLYDSIDRVLLALSLSLSSSFLEEKRKENESFDYSKNKVNQTNIKIKWR